MYCCHTCAVFLNVYCVFLQWFMTLFTYNFPFAVVVRIWDAVLSEGWKVIFRVALALLKTNEGIPISTADTACLLHPCCVCVLMTPCSGPVSALVRDNHDTF